MPWSSAVRKVPELYGSQALLPEIEYRRLLAIGRIRFEDIVESLDSQSADIETRVADGLISRRQLRLELIAGPPQPANLQELNWELAEADAHVRLPRDISATSRVEMLRSARQWGARLHLATTDRKVSGIDTSLQASLAQLLDSTRLPPDQWSDSTAEEIGQRMLWTIAIHHIRRQSPRPATPSTPRWRELLLDATGQDSDLLVHEVLIPLCSSFLDQGSARWTLPGRDAGLLAAFTGLVRSGRFPGRRWLRTLSRELQFLADNGQTPLQSIAASLEQLGIPESEHDVFLQSTALALRGWAGMIWQTETRPDRVFRASPAGSFIEFMAIRLILEKLATIHVAATLGHTPETLPQLRSQLLAARSRRTPDPHLEAFPFVHLAARCGWSPERLASLPNEHWDNLIQEVQAFDEIERRILLHEAYERRLERETLEAVSIRSQQPARSPAAPRLQVMTCIDAREESFRRHLEEVAGDVETFGNAGFFNVPMYYRGLADASFSALCPIVVTPRHWVAEDIVDPLVDSHRARARARRLLGTASRGFQTGSRGSLSGALLTAFVGPLATAPLVGRILFPRLTSQLSRTARQLVAPPAITRLILERDDRCPPGPHDEGLGFTLPEMTNIAERALRDTGLTSRFAPLVMILGHGSSCLNNPHESAYHCGACSGSAGGPNARALASILNDVRIRKRLRERQIDIPDDTWFLGGMHNTATEDITFFDLELLPSWHRRPLRELRELFQEVARRNARERCRRFDSARLDIPLDAALQHVRDRADDLAQTRPEYGNGTCALCFVGRRSRIRGLFLDRRCFQMSYDATQDDEAGEILARILAAVVPVCSGISQLYSLSAIDNAGFGSGTKLPHNVTSLLGVMDGAASDLRPGLPFQGVDIHEPVRLLFVIESTPAVMNRILDTDAVVGRLFRNDWARLIVLDPHSSTMQRLHKGTFVPVTTDRSSLPSATSSEAWYSGRREHLPFALIEPGAHG
jgi:hypothetical protein